ncbi:hypothetical protein O181_011467 [Austropuccinia psidii MF-1]|uniref:Uncharacterized protein n=1 Tax=Austropuccinia psidii MF-1 TaxID=1389203 RepID=A0A9Q3BVS5_9BASI|nr:hypothetical protein [Austropuccinia psidii MF-1]
MLEDEKTLSVKASFLATLKIGAAICDAIAQLGGAIQWFTSMWFCTARGDALRAMARENSALPTVNLAVSALAINFLRALPASVCHLSNTLVRLSFPDNFECQPTIDRLENGFTRLPGYFIGLIGWHCALFWLLANCLKVATHKLMDAFRLTSSSNSPYPVCSCLQAFYDPHCCIVQAACRPGVTVFGVGYPTAFLLGDPQLKC